MEVAMPSRRSLLSYAVGSAAFSSGLFPSDWAHSATTQFVGMDGWLNTDVPPTMAGLRGKVVLVQFCTYTCINWRRTLPYIKRWHSDYGPQGLQIIGVHTPEFGFERDRANVESAIREMDVRYPIGLDNEYQTWQAWENRAWPSFYLLDKAGQVRLARDGEGYSQEIEAAIQNLIGPMRGGLREPRAEDADLSRVETPEMYFGSLHRTPQDRAQSPQRGQATYSFARSSGPMWNEYQLDGSWAREGEALTLRSRHGRVRVRFSAAKLYLVAGSSQPALVRIGVDAREKPEIGISRQTLYTLVDGDSYGEHLLELECATSGLSLFSATFG
jgi:thiol-disulfide isomerase/thioredoxin